MTEDNKNRIYELLKQKNITQKKLSEETGITESAISRYIKGERTPRGANLIKIARALGVTTDEIFNKDYDFNSIKLLIARNIQNMSLEEKTQIIKILFDEEH